jgi:crotonobetaine/carnitine-CoA ligase
VLWTHSKAVWGARVTALHQALRDSDVHFINNPLFHTNAQTYSLLPTLWVGGTAVLSPRYSASRFWDVAIRNRCTWAMVTNFMVQTLKDQPVPRHFFRNWGGAYSDPPEDEQLRVRTLGAFGMTETITQAVVAEPFQDNRAGSMGRPSPFYDVEVRRPDGSAVAPGETGSLFVRGVRGVSLFQEYLADAAATAAAFDERGFLITGDVVRYEADGSLTFADRAKDMLKVGAENVAASEVESVIRLVPGVREVAVVGQPHSLYDEVPVAFLIVDPSAHDVGERAHSACREQLAKFKVPWSFHLVEELPRSLLGKVAKAELRAQLPALDASARADHMRREP